MHIFRMKSEESFEHGAPWSHAETTSGMSLLMLIQCWFDMAVFSGHLYKGTIFVLPTEVSQQ